MNWQVRAAYCLYRMFPYLESVLFLYLLFQLVLCIESVLLFVCVYTVCIMFTVCIHAAAIAVSTMLLTGCIHMYRPTRVSVQSTGSVCRFVFLYFSVFFTSHALDTGISILFFNLTMVFPVFYTSCYAGCFNSFSWVSAPVFT